MVSPNTTGQMKIEYGATELTDGISARILWGENSVALAKIASWNLDAATFLAKLDAFTNLKISFRYNSDSWTKYFDGIIEDVNPILTENDQTVIATAYGKGRALRNTYCNTSYGVESQNSAKDTPGAIWTDIVDNYVEKSFAGSATGYSLNLSYNNGTLPSINHLRNPYNLNVDVLTKTLLLIQAYRAGSSGHHWIVFPTNNTLYIKRIGTDLGSWPSWWQTDQAGSTLVEGTDFIEYSFAKRVRSKDFANKILLMTDLRKPGYDYWCEDAATNGLWIVSGNGSVSDDTVNKQVGGDSLKLTADASQWVDFYYPSGQAANWDFTNIGSENNPPHIRFYARRTGNANHQVQIELHTTDQSNHFFQNLFNTASDTHFMPTAGDWYQLDFPLISGQPDGWESFGSPDWSNIDFINITFNNTGYAGSNDFWIDDLHFTGKIVREAYNSTNIGTNGEYQKVVVMNTAVDDSMIAGTDTGMAARLAYAELLRAQTIPIVGTVRLYGIVDIYPGQFVHIHAEKTNGTYRIDNDFRVKQVEQEFSGYHAFYTTLHLTDDSVNSFAKGPAEIISAYHAVVFADPEAQSLKATGVDPLVPRLSKDYP